MGPQTFYYSFISLMNLKNAKNILEVACGSGKLLPLAIMLKNQNTKYHAVDLS
jgi:ubiquinone/menaquinone biosynthesis C-methylase UbiE